MTIVNNIVCKKRRLLEAFIEVEDQQNNQPMPKQIHLEQIGVYQGFQSPDELRQPIQQNDIITKVESSTDTCDLERLNPIKPLLSERVINLIEAKLKIFEKWELKKQDAIKKLYQFTDSLTEKELKLKKLRSLKRKREGKRKQIKFLTKIPKNPLDQNEDDEDDNESSEKMSNESDTQIPIKTTILGKRTHQSNNKANKTKIAKREEDKLFKHPGNHNNTSIKKEQTIESNKKDEKLIPIGPNGTMVSEKVLQLINWNQPTAATRKLLMTVFDRDTLAFHTLTGKPSPAFMGCDRPLKDQLNPLKVADIIHIVTRKSNAPERDIRSAITTKCADENKMYKQRQKRQDKLAKIQANKENYKRNMTI